MLVLFGFLAANVDLSFLTRGPIETSCQGVQTWQLTGETNKQKVIAAHCTATSGAAVSASASVPQEVLLVLMVLKGGRGICQEVSHRDLANKALIESLHRDLAKIFFNRDLLQRSCQEVTCIDLAKRAAIESFYRDLIKRLCQETSYTTKKYQNTQWWPNLPNEPISRSGKQGRSMAKHRPIPTTISPTASTAVLQSSMELSTVPKSTVARTPLSATALSTTTTTSRKTTTATVAYRRSKSKLLESAKQHSRICRRIQTSWMEMCPTAGWLLPRSLSWMALG